MAAGPYKIKMLFRSITFAIGIVSLLAIIFGSLIYFCYLDEQKKKADLEQVVSSLRMDAIKAQVDDELEKADKLFTQALYDSEHAGSSMRVIEFISRLVQVKIQRHKLQQTEPLIQKAIKLASTINNSSASDSNMEIWLNDMADAFYRRGERSTRDEIKRYCLERYLRINLSTALNYEPVFIGRANLLKDDYEQLGDYDSLVQCDENICSYLERCKPKDDSITGEAYLALGVSNLLARRSIGAAGALEKWRVLRNANKKSLDDPRYYFYCGHVKELEGNGRLAQQLYQKALCMMTNRAKAYDSFNDVIYSGLFGAVLGVLESKMSDNGKANHNLNDSLTVFSKCPVPEVNSSNEKSHPDGIVYAGRVFCLEHLSLLPSTDPLIAKTFKEQAKKIRKKNAYWSAAKNKDQDYFYSIAGLFPYPVEVVPTHLLLR